MDVLSKLMALRRIFIKQKNQWLKEFMFGDMPNTYMVYAADNDGNIIKHCPILKAKEKSNCLVRYLLHP